MNLQVGIVAVRDLLGCFVAIRRKGLAIKPFFGFYTAEKGSLKGLGVQFGPEGSFGFEVLASSDGTSAPAEGRARDLQPPTSCPKP